MMDKLSKKLLRKLYRKDLPEDKARRILKISIANQQDTRITQLKSDRMISVRQNGGTPDGEGGFIDGTVNRMYHLEPNGRAEVEHARSSRLKWMIATGIALASAIAAIVSALPKWE